LQLDIKRQTFAKVACDNPSNHQFCANHSFKNQAIGGLHHPLSPVIPLGFRHPTKKERKKDKFVFPIASDLAKNEKIEVEGKGINIEGRRPM